MKKAYSPEVVLEAVKSLDTRTQVLPPEKLNAIIDDAYTELCTVIQAFSNEEVVQLQSYYDLGEEKVTLDIEEDVSEIYDYT